MTPQSIQNKLTEKDKTIFKERNRRIKAERESGLLASKLNLVELKIKQIVSRLKELEGR